MGEKKLIQHRCLAVQLVKKTLLPSPGGCGGGGKGGSSDSSDTPTPVNEPFTHIQASNNNTQDGYQLFGVWRAAIVECTWDKELVEAARATQYLGYLVGGVILLGGPPSALSTLSLAWSRSLLVAPSGYSLTMLGEVHGLNVVLVPQGQFTPLADALCWVVHHLTREGCKAGAEAVREALEISFPTMMAPSLSHIHATLSSLIQQCKVYYTGTTYGIVHPGTYCPSITPPSEAPVSARDGKVTKAAQTDLAELITGTPHSSDTVIVPSVSDGVSGRRAKASLDAMSRSHHQFHRNHHQYNSGRAASLRLSPASVSIFASHFAASPVATFHTYRAQDLSDITIRGERASVFSKLLRVPGRRRIASFAVQFPPPEWSDSHAPVLHLHSVAVQTSTQQGEVKPWHLSATQWTPRSATLPRRIRRPHSSTPPLPDTQQSSPTPRMFTPILQVHTSPKLGGSSSHSHNDRKGRTYRYQSQGHKRSESRSRDSSSSEGLADHRQIKPPLAFNYTGKKNQPDNVCHKIKEPTVPLTNMVGKVNPEYQLVDPFQCEEKLLERLQDCHVRTTKNEIPTGRQQSNKQKHGKTEHRGDPSHSPHNKHTRHRRHKSEAKVEKNQQAETSKLTFGNHMHAISQDDNLSDNKEITKKAEETNQTENSRQYQRTSLHLDLTSDHMNNCRKVVASPQRPHGLTTNLLHQAPDIQQITKGSTPDLTSKNLGYQDIDKCHKKTCDQTLDQVQKPDPRILHGKKLILSPGTSEEGEPGQDKRSVSTYPSLSELNLTFSSLAAQKILSGASVNSLDTLAEVNLAAIKRNTDGVPSTLTNTDLGFV